jgi:hypothetical protein
MEGRLVDETRSLALPPGNNEPHLLSISLSPYPQQSRAIGQEERRTHDYSLI